jgi:hypothetical protein
MTDWLEKSREAMSTSTTYLDTNYRAQWENNLRAFQSRHHATSKYNSDVYKWRSKVFRPKTRSAIRNNEAAVAAAFFSNPDVVAISAADPSNKVQQASAEIMFELLQYRLTTYKQIPWFITLCGGFQDSSIIGAVASFQSWKYREKKIKNVVQFEDGESQTIEEDKVIEDKPDVELLPVENIRIHPSSDWRDPVNTSPYLLRLIPMYVMDVKARMSDDMEGGTYKKWKKLDDAQIKSGLTFNYDSTRLTREDGREDKYQNVTTTNAVLSDYDIVWVVENFMRQSDGSDVVFYTLGTEELLCDPVDIEEIYFTGDRPIVMGIAILETHKILPTAPAQLGENIQREINEVTNSRLDNIKLVLNKRHLVKRGSQVDLKSMLRNVAGSVTFVNDVNEDVKSFEYQDVTSSSYEEQTRLSTEYDELVGNFSGSSIANSRKLNETVGGMQMLRSGAFGLTEYLVRTFSETWVKPVLWQLIRLEQKYESDFTVMAIAGAKAKIFQKYGIDEVTDELLNQSLTIEVNVGTGATDPLMKLNQFLTALEKLTVILKDPPPNLNIEEVQKEIFGRLGHKDGERFFIRPDEMSQKEMELVQAIQQQQQIIEQLKAALDSKDRDHQAKILETVIKEEGASARTAADNETKITAEIIKLQNPVPGEKIDGRGNSNSAG